MNLTPEEKAVGKQNFNEASGFNLNANRRDFIKGAIAGGAVAGASLGAMYYGYGSIKNDRLRVGIIGTGDEGGVLIGALNPDYIDVVAIADIRPYNIHRAFYGDMSSDATMKPRPGLCKIYGWKDRAEGENHVKIYCQKEKQTYEELINDPNVEAVIIALPLHLHDAAAIKAMRAGKHVLTEKLMAHSVRQCKEMARVADATGMILATGHQRHYSILYANAVDQISSGLIGDVHHIRAQWHRDNLPGGDSWQPPLPTKFMESAAFSTLEKETKAKGGDAALAALRNEYRIQRELYAWQKELKNQTLESEIAKWERKVEQKREQLEDARVDAKYYGYQERELKEVGRTRTPLEELIRWRLWDRTGGGLMAELGSHQLDASSIFISAQNPAHEKVLPLSVTGNGTRSLFPMDRDVDDHVYTMFEFPAPGYYKEGFKGEVADPNKKTIVTYSSINGNGFGGYGEVVFGTKGTLILDREQEAMLFKKAETMTQISVVAGKDGKPAMDTYETGGGMAAVAEAALPKDVSRGYKEEIEHWAWCIRNPSPENQPKCTPKVAMADAVIALTSNIAMKENRKIEFKREWFDIKSDETPEGIAPRPTESLV
jgi:predicted dehydrogenase